jgi:uncharacterized LabA/DUF88 family protein
MDTIGSGSAGQASADRVAVFIDGFNVYWGLRDKGFKRFYWLDYQALASHLVRDGQVLVATKFFTTRVTKPADRRTRQSTFLAALRARGGVDIIEGKYRSRTVKCKQCSAKWDAPDEKMTDVAIATHMLTGACHDEYDTALLVCADADLIPAVHAVAPRGSRC